MLNNQAVAVELDAQVYPSEQKTIVVMVPEGDEYGGAHEYWITNCLGFEGGKTSYQFEKNEEGEICPRGQKIQFIQKDNDGNITPGLQSEQLVYVLLDRHTKLNTRFPSAQNEKMLQGLQMFIDACQERVEERIKRGVMGQLKS
jgi:hypothetical protein